MKIVAGMVRLAIYLFVFFAVFPWAFGAVDNAWIKLILLVLWFFGLMIPLIILTFDGLADDLKVLIGKKDD